MEKEREIDEKIVDWISEFVDYLKKEKQQMLTFLARRIAFERWLVPEFGFFIKDKVKNLQSENEVFFELGKAFDLLICPPLKKSTNLLKHLEGNHRLVVEFKASTRHSKKLSSDNLVKNIRSDVRKLKKYAGKIEGRYVVGFLYGLSASKGNPFLRGGWHPLDHGKLDDQFDEMRTSVENGIQSDAIEPLHHTQNISLTFGDANISGKATFLIYKVRKAQARQEAL